MCVIRDFSICVYLFTGQVILTATTNPQEVPIIVTEGNNVTFQCRIQSATITLLVRLPGENTFGTFLPANVILVGIDNEATITVVNAQRSENSTAFQCGAGGAFTDIGVLDVYCKLYYWMKRNERERNYSMCCLLILTVF